MDMALLVLCRWVESGSARDATQVFVAGRLVKVRKIQDLKGLRETSADF
jgi:hypothetical protein